MAETAESALSYDPDGASGLSQLLPAADARIMVDGIERTSSSNTVADLIDKVSLTFTKAEPGVVRELRIEGDASLQRNSVKGFVSAYNAALGAIGQVTAYNVEAKTAAALNGDAMVRNATRELRDILGDNVMDLKAIGITINKDGTLKLDEAAFDKGMAASRGRVAHVRRRWHGRQGRFRGRPPDRPGRTAGRTQREPECTQQGARQPAQLARLPHEPGRIALPHPVHRARRAAELAPEQQRFPHPATRNTQLDGLT